MTVASYVIFVVGRAPSRGKKVFLSTLAFLLARGLVVFNKDLLTVAFDYISHV